MYYYTLSYVSNDSHKQTQLHFATKEDAIAWVEEFFLTSASYKVLTRICGYNMYEPAVIDKGIEIVENELGIFVYHNYINHEGVEVHHFTLATIVKQSIRIVGENKRKVYVYTSQWNEGEAFAGEVIAEAFTTLSAAQDRLCADANQAIELISNEYGDYYEQEAGDDYDPTMERLIGDSDEYQRDWWEGKIIEQEISL